MNPMQETINMLSTVMVALTDEKFKIDLAVDEDFNVVLGVMFPEKGITTFMSNGGVVNDDGHPQDCWVDTHPLSMTAKFFDIGMSNVKYFGTKYGGKRYRVLDPHENVGNSIKLARLAFERILAVVEKTHNKWIW